MEALSIIALALRVGRDASQRGAYYLASPIRFVLMHEDQAECGDVREAIDNIVISKHNMIVMDKSRGMNHMSVSRTSLCERS